VDQRPLSIGEVAEASGVSRDAIRYYERLGLLPKAGRTTAGYRKYPQGVLGRLVLVRNAQRFGFSLTEIAGFLRVRDRGGKPCHAVRAAGERMLKAVDDQIAELQTARKQMDATLRAWGRTLDRTPGDQQAHLLEALGKPGARGLEMSPRPSERRRISQIRPSTVPPLTS
jgi:DNA-binding transcriptional MerR regulator